MHLAVTELVVPTNKSQAACELPYQDGRLPLLFLYGGVLAVGFPANLLTLRLTWLQVRRRSVLGVYLLALSLCDLGYLCTLPLWARYVHGGHVWAWSSAACRLTGFLFFTNMYVSIFLLVCVSCDRYVAVVYSLESRGLRRRRHAAAVTVAVLLAVSVGHAPVFSMREGEGGEGERRCFEPGRSATVTGFYYARFLLGFLLPLLLLVATNRGVLGGVRRSTGLRREQKERVRRLAVAVVMLFLVCFAPYHLVLLLRALLYSATSPPGCLMQRRLDAAYTASLALSTVNSAANPVLYVLSSHSVRRELRGGVAQLWTRCFDFLLTEGQLPVALLLVAMTTDSEKKWVRS
ncbi:probable G-protein coupled receptor 132 [Scomber scombrus]|uniref:probable G-protein coupled receptor 132 n=1 Tax=Scomber scombrus TaxID=13677 RepID=UPI002DD96A47|nr:probable G-protein coupled receptor 132 [Scomber scombrus]